MADKKRASLMDLTTGTSALSKHVVGKGEAVRDAPAREAAQAATGNTKKRFMQTRLTDDDWIIIDDLSHRLRKPLQALTIEAWNDLLRKYGEGTTLQGPPVGKRGPKPAGDQS